MTLVELARAAGRKGTEWLSFTWSDEAQALIDTIYGDVDAAESAWTEGRREHRIKDLGWVVFFTTAPDDYDTLGTETIETCGDWKGKHLRKVLSHPHHTEYQKDRYASGINGSWDVDPRVTEEAERIKRETWAREDAERVTKRTAALARLQAMTDEELESLDDDAAGAFNYEDLRAEKIKRAKAKVEEIRESCWEEATTLIPEGVTLLDEGLPGFRGVYGWIAGQPTHVHYSIVYEDAYTRDVDKAYFHGQGVRDKGGIGLSIAVEWLRAGRLKIVKPDEVPPQKVVERIGHDNVKKIQRHAMSNRVVWTGAANSWSPLLILDENGRIVRAKKVLEELQGVILAHRV